MENYSNLNIETFINQIIGKKVKLKSYYKVEQYYNQLQSKYIIDIISTDEESLTSYLGTKYFEMFDNYMNNRITSSLINMNIKIVDPEYHFQIKNNIKYHIFRYIIIIMDTIYNNKQLPTWNNPNIFENVKIKSPIDYTSDIIKRSKIGGLSVDQILSSPFCYLEHNTELLSLDAIFKQGGLKNRLLLGRENLSARMGGAGSYEVNNVESNAKNQRQFPGSYFYIISQLDLLNKCKINQLDNDYQNIGINISLVFSLSLLQQINWHLNITDNYGKINNLTFSAKTLPEYLNKLPTLYGFSDCSRGFCDEELIFHDKISMDFCEAIIVSDEKTKNEVIKLLEYNYMKIPVYIKTDELLKSLVNIQFLRYLDNYEKLDHSKPNFCYTGNGGVTPYGYEGFENYDENEYQDYSGISLFDNINPYTLKSIKTENNSPLNNRDTLKFENINKIYNSKTEDEYLWNINLQNCGIKDKYSEDKEEVLYHKIEDKMEQIYFGNADRPEVKNYPPFKYIPEFYKKFDQ